MRRSYWGVSAVLSAAAITVAYVVATRPDREPMPTETGGDLHEDVSSELAALRARVAELEEALARTNAPPAAVEAAPSDAPGSPQPEAIASPTEPTGDLESLLALLEQGDLEGLTSVLARLLAEGEGSNALLTEFLRGLMSPPDFRLMRDKGLSIALLAAALKQPQEASELALHLLSVLDPAKDQALRYQVLSFLSGFLPQGRDSGSELRGRLEEQLLGDLDEGGAGPHLWQSLQALNELGVEVPVESLAGVLADPSRKNEHYMVIHQLSQRGDDAAVELIVEHIHRQQDAKDWSLDQAFQVLARMENPRAQGALEQYIDSPVEPVARAATLAYFTKPRDAASERLAVGFLESEADLGQKQRLLWQLRSSSPEIFSGIQSRVDELPSEDLREVVRKIAETRMQFGGVAVQPGGTKQAE